MNTPILHIKDIPEDVYAQLPIFVYNSWKKQFTKLMVYNDKLINNKIELPLNKVIQKKLQGFTFYIIKAESDVLNLKYEIFFRVNPINFKNKLNPYFKDHGINFDYDLFCDKAKLISVIEKGLSQILNCKISITMRPRNVTFTATVLLKTKSDVIIM